MCDRGFWRIPPRLVDKGAAKLRLLLISKLLLLWRGGLFLPLQPSARGIQQILRLMPALVTALLKMPLPAQPVRLPPAFRGIHHENSRQQKEGRGHFPHHQGADEKQGPNAIAQDAPAMPGPKLANK